MSAARAIAFELKRSTRQLTAAPWVFRELRRCRRDVGALGLNGSLEKARQRARRPTGPVLGQLTPDELAGLVVRLARTRTSRSSCLRRAIALWVLLRRSGRDPVLRLGAPVDGAMLQMHAWVELDGEPIGESPGVVAQFLAFDLGGKLPVDVIGRAERVS